MTSLLPYNLQDDAFLALEQLAQDAVNIDIKSIMTSVVDYVPDAVLPALAEMFSVLDEGFYTCSTREEKIELIKNAVWLHKRKGTIGAVKDLLNAYGLTAVIWREYGGIPHHYKIELTDTTASLDIYDSMEKLLARIDQYKQLRAKMDDVTFNWQSDKYEYISSAVIQGDVLTVDIGASD